MKATQLRLKDNSTPNNNSGIYIVYGRKKMNKMNSSESKTENPKNPENPIELIVTVVVITAVCSITICTICGWIGFKVIYFYPNKSYRKVPRVTIQEIRIFAF